MCKAVIVSDYREYFRAEKNSIPERAVIESHAFIAICIEPAIKFNCSAPSNLSVINNSNSHFPSTSGITNVLAEERFQVGMDLKERTETRQG